MQKTARKNTEYSRNETISIISKNVLHAKPIVFAKSSLSVKKWNSRNSMKNEPKSTSYLFYAKNRPKKLLIFEKWEHFEYRQ